MAKNSTIGFGKYAGRELQDVPEDYLQYLINSSKEKIEVYQNELDRRTALEEADVDDVDRIIRHGYRELAKKAHPDGGGTQAAFTALRGAYEMLLSASKTIKEVKSETAKI